MLFFLFLNKLKAHSMALLFLLQSVHVITFLMLVRVKFFIQLFIYYRIIHLFSSYLYDC
jgi:hypothetical protein